MKPRFQYLRASGRVHDYAAHLTTGSIGAAGVGPILSGIVCTIAALLVSWDLSEPGQQRR